MKIVEKGKWKYYLGRDHMDLAFSAECGKWLMFPKTMEYAEKICSEAVEKGIVAEAKHAVEDGAGNRECPCCFYLEGSDLRGHRRVIEFFRDNGYLPVKKNGEYMNLAYKYDETTRLGIYGSRASSKHLADFIDLKTGRFKEEFIEQEKAIIEEKQIKEEISRRISKYLGVKMSFGCAFLKDGDYFDGAFVKQEMKKQGVSVSDIAQKLDVKDATLRRWLKGYTRPYVWNALAICVYLNLDEQKVIHTV